MHSLTTTHLTAVKRILRYVKATYNHGLLYKPGLSHLTAFSDADYAGNPDTRHSTGGFCIYFGSNLVSWSSKKHKTVSSAPILCLRLQSAAGLHSCGTVMAKVSFP
ncbi:hypothetical protein L3X38_036899 [Prunus dulcis]|uniref:Mitochondrial protein n=1 Tax=Prunus dulcis TaxID=3755 RepID=A0AAD4V4E3_PRUDU|nr:hypothetical protein L3X38_036899 [Prunus dulcis]